MHDKLLIEVLKILPILLIIVVVVWTYRKPVTKRVKLKINSLSLDFEKFRELIKIDYNITKLSLVDSQGRKLNPYPLREGENIFKCMVTYTDGTTVEYAPYWLCWPEGSSDCWGVFGNQRRKQVTVNCYQNHERYTELSCWVFPPKKEESNEHVPHDSIGFVYPYDN